MSMHGMDNGNAFMRAQREAQIAAAQAAILRQAYNNPMGPFGQYPPRAWTEPPIAGEPEPEDTTGLKMLEEFLAKRKGERDDAERK